MQQPLPATPQSEPENKCLGCLFMKLEAIPVDLEKQDSFDLKSNSATTDSINLSLTLEFKEQREQFFGGRIKFGLRGGQLRLQLENGEVPLECRRLNGSVKLGFTHERQQQEGSEAQGGVEGAAATNQWVVQTNLGTKNSKERTDTSQFVSCEITTKGSEENPVWVFAVETGEPVLKGLLKNVNLGTLNVMGKPWRVVATFEVSPQDVYLTEVEGLFPKSISKKRRVVIERAIARCLLEHKLKPYLSRQELRYD